MEIKELYPVSEELAALKAEKDQELIDIITGASDKFMVIIGPCSADNEEAVCDYIGRLTKVQEKVKDKLVLVPRIYTNKPRTTGEGYKGMLHQPDPEKAPDLLNGLIAIRKIHMHALQTFHMPMRCFTLKTSDICPISSLMLLLVHAPLRISSIVWLPVALKCQPV